jgi:hypothetical protein
MGRKGKDKAGVKEGRYLCIRVLGLCFGFGFGYSGVAI